MSAWKVLSTPRVQDVVGYATRVFGRKAGYRIAADVLGIAERTARGIAYGEASGASIPQQRVEAAWQALRRERAAKLRAELQALEQEAACAAGSLFHASSPGSAIDATTPLKPACAAPAAHCA